VVRGTIHVSRVPRSGPPLPLLALICEPDGVKRPEMGSKVAFPADGARLWRPSPTEGVVPREQLKVYFFLPHACPVPVKMGLERNRSAVGKTANSFVSPQPQQLTPLPCGGPGSTPAWNQGDPRCEFPPGPRRAAGSDRFWLCELRESQHFSTFYGSSVQSMGTQLNALPILPVLARCVSGCVNSALLGLERNRPAVVTSQLLGEPASALLCSCFAAESLAQTAPLARATNLHI
jgi:hypothetical protein